MQARKILVLTIILLFTARIAFCQNEIYKGVINNLALYRQKKELKFLGNAKKSVDSLITTRADSLDLKKSVYRAVVNSSILYIDSLNKLNQQPALFDQTTKLVDKLSDNKRIYDFQQEMDYVHRCLANVYIREAYVYVNKSDFVNALKLFHQAKKYAPAYQQLDLYIAYSNNKLGNLQAAATYYNDLINKGNAKIEYIETASNIYKSIGDTVAALAVLKKGRNLLPDEKSLIIDEANIYNNKKDFGSLAPLLPMLLAADRDNADVAFVAANCFDHLKQFDKAEPLYLRAIELNSSSFDTAFNLGLLYFKESRDVTNKGRTQNALRAVQWLKKANEITPGNTNCLHMLQLAYTETGNQDEINNVNNQLKQLTN